MTDQLPFPDDYAPYHRYPSFDDGARAYERQNFTNPYIGDSFNAQAWERGLEYAMRLEQWKSKQ
jgi:hypothetical protein